MKVYSLYHNDTYVASFKSREDAIFYGKQFYEEGWTCNIIEEYLNKSPILYGSPYTTLTPLQTIPCSPGLTLTPATVPQTNPGTYPNVWCEGVKAETDKPIPGGWLIMTEPTDEQLDELWDEIGGYYNLYPEVRNTIREALKRWGTLKPISLKEKELTEKFDDWVKGMKQLDPECEKALYDNL